MEEKKTADEEKNVGTEEKAEKEEKTAALSDVQQKKLICALAYLFGILFFLPLIVYPDDDFAKFHANQSLVILIVSIVGEAVFGILSIIPVLNVIFGILCVVFGLLMLIVCILGIVGVVKGEKYEIPVIGSIKILK